MFGTAHQGFSEWMLWGQGDKGGTKKGVWTGGVDFDVIVASIDTEEDVGSLRTTQPVPLERLYVLWEADGIKSVVQFLPVGWKIEKPLTHLFLCHGTIAAPTTTGLDLLIG